MQTINKSLVKNTFTYTWFIYPIAAVLLSLIWLWSFPLAHAPSEREKIEMFIYADVISEKFADNILKKYDREKLRAINMDYTASMGATEKIRMGFTRCDMMILPQGTYLSNKSAYSDVFAEINPYIQEKCQIDSSLVVEDYGILLKAANTHHYLSEFIKFDSSIDYVITFLARSKNLGAAFDENNAKYDNALTVAHYLIEGVE